MTNTSACLGVHPKTQESCPERERCRRWVHRNDLNGPLMHMVCFGKNGYPYMIRIEQAKL